MAGTLLHIYRSEKKQIMNPDFLFKLLKIAAKIAQEKQRKSLVISRIPFSWNIITKCNGIDNQLYGELEEL